MSDNGDNIIRFPGTPSTGDPPAEEPMPPPSGQIVAEDSHDTYSTFDDFRDNEVTDAQIRFNELVEQRGEEFWETLEVLRNQINGWRRT